MKSAIVLGASSGVGAHIAASLSRDHTVHGFHRGHYPSSANILRHAYGVQMHKADAGTTLTDAKTAIEIAAMEVVPHTVRVVVHSISGASVGSALDIDELDVERTFNRLAHSFMWWVRGLIKSKLIARECLFLALSNPCPDFYLTNSGVIGPAKAALEAYVRVLAAELHGTDWRVNALRFSTVVTPALQKVMPQAIPGLSKLHSHIQHAGRMQTCEDVGDLVQMLASSEARWINGAIIDGTGGAPSMLMDYAFKQAAR